MQEVDPRRRQAVVDGPADDPLEVTRPWRSGFDTVVDIDPCRRRSVCCAHLEHLPAVAIRHAFGSVEDRVHQVLADRLESIHQLFGQIPDTLEDVWVRIALQDEQEARRLIDRTAATQNPFDAKYSVVEDADWETCSVVLDPSAVREQLSCGW